ncbi:MAG: division/cell wall cluster transcriptional repressor MraZ [Lewinellaceae bacterium]|nr:division/cell wall cluster transcriptional repressor MraZ [Lewinellaceae bacterium]
MNLIGEFQVAIDNKGRLRLPTALLRQLPELQEGASHAFVLNRGFEPCLTLYPKSVWDQITQKLSKLNRFNDRNRMFFRSFFLGAAQLETDAADRILLPKPLMDYADLQDDAILVAMEDRIEIWSQIGYTRMLSINPNDYADLANKVMGGGDDGVGEEED